VSITNPRGGEHHQPTGRWASPTARQSVSRRWHLASV